ncbi:MAG: penicillin-binding protein 2 [Bifidobacteriaceae bacterium]|jgi:peptidoglycan glycosyltransferase|nr:penicillin-binding protein 2 [Bifidobacteriaceae bacterium]
MNKQISRVGVLVIFLSLVLIASSSYWQFFQVSALRSDTRNTRQLYNEYDHKRGDILVDGKAIAYSEKSNDEFEYQRKYVDGQLYSAVTGFYSITNRADRGLEAAQNSYLDGSADIFWLDQILNSFMGKGQVGGSVETTISSKLQKVAWDALGDRKGAVLAMDPKTGAILAMVSKPAYDPNDLAIHNSAKASDVYSELAQGLESPLINKTISALYPPGSTFKVIDSASAISSGNYNKDSNIPSPQFYRLPGTITNLPNYNNEVCSSTGNQALLDALRISCNTAFAMLGVKLGQANIASQANLFGVGTKFILADAQNSLALESSPSVFPKNLTDDKLALASIGQGDVKFTPLQDLLISAVVANNGKLPYPYLVKDIKDPSGRIVKQFPLSQYSEQFSNPVISYDTAQQLNTMMQAVVQRGGAFNAQIPGVIVAGKTGTAQTTQNATPHAWFTGFAPADNPKIAVCVLVEDGENDPTGASASAPVAKQVMQAALQ